MSAHLQEALKEKQELLDQFKAVQDKWNTYNEQTKDQIKKILDDAGVYNDIQAIEQQRADVLNKAKVKAKEIELKVVDLNKIISYLEGKSPAAVEVPEEPEESSPAENPVEETEEVVAEAEKSPSADDAGKAAEVKEDGEKPPLTPPDF